jgi:hypothetical protein
MNQSRRGVGVAFELHAVFERVDSRLDGRTASRRVLRVDGDSSPYAVHGLGDRGHHRLRDRFVIGSPVTDDLAPPGSGGLLCRHPRKVRVTDSQPPTIEEVARPSHPRARVHDCRQVWVGAEPVGRIPGQARGADGQDSLVNGQDHLLAQESVVELVARLMCPGMCVNVDEARQDPARHLDIHAFGCVVRPTPVDPHQAHHIPVRQSTASDLDQSICHEIILARRGAPSAHSRHPALRTTFSVMLIVALLPAYMRAMRTIPAHFAAGT